MLRSNGAMLLKTFLNKLEGRISNLHVVSDISIGHNDDQIPKGDGVKFI